MEKYCEQLKLETTELKSEVQYLFDTFEKKSKQAFLEELIEKLKKDIEEKLNFYEKNSDEFLFAHQSLYFLSNLIKKGQINRLAKGNCLAGIEGVNADKISTHIIVGVRKAWKDAEKNNK